MTAQDHPEPVEPTMASVPGGLYCIDHGVMDCELPFCWRCGNHLMDSFDRCADQHCRATNTPEALAIVEEVKARYPNSPAPIEAIATTIGHHFLEVTGIYFYVTSPSFSSPGEPGRGPVEAGGPASGAGS